MLTPITQQQVEEARDQATDLRDRVNGAGTAVGEPAEEIAATTDAIAWMAAEVRAQRLEAALAEGR